MLSAIGAIIGLIIAILLIIKKVSPFYSLLLGALIGGMVGGMPLTDTVASMVGGIKDIVPAIVRILAAGILSGVLIKTGGAEAIATGFIRKLGAKNISWALALSCMLLCAVGVFIDVAVITIAPIAMLAAARSKESNSKLLLMMIGGGKCGNIISPNPNTIIAAENFGADLSRVMAANIIPAVVGLLFTVLVISRLFRNTDSSDASSDVERTINEPSTKELPNFWAALSGPIVAILLLALRPICGFTVDPMVALPVGGLAGLLIMRRGKIWRESIEYGLSKMAPIAVLLVGTGALAGIIKDSSLTSYIVAMLGGIQGGKYLIAPLAGILMSGATASTTAGATIASSSFAPTVLQMGISAVWGAAMVNAGATVIDHLPHGSFFHATGGSMECSFKQRLRLIPYECLIGLVLTAVSVACCVMMN